MATVALLACAKTTAPVDREGGVGGGGGAMVGEDGGGGHGGGITFSSVAVPLDGAADSAILTTSDIDGGPCEATTGSFTKKEADLLIVLDRSSSMSFDIATTYQCRIADPNCVDRWSTVTSALGQVLANSPPDVHWGLKFFPSTPGTSNCIVNPGVDVEIPATSDEIQTAIAMASTGAQTPTKAAINEAVAYYQTLNDDRSHFILLATDGQPNCDPGTSSNASVLAKTNAQAAIANAAKAGIKTYVIGIGPAAGNLDDFAVAGGTEKQYPATSANDLTVALSKIAAAVVTCTFNLKSPPQEPKNLVVQFNGDKNLRAPRDTTHANGWDYTSPSNDGIELYGTWCDKLKNQQYQSIAILMGCPE